MTHSQWIVIVANAFTAVVSGSSLVASYHTRRIVRKQQQERERR